MVIGDALRRSCRNYPSKLALKDEYGKYFPAGTSYTYAELGGAVNRLANNLLQLGLQRGDRVSVQTGTGLGHVISLLALAKVGIAIAPIDRTYMPDEIAYQVNDAGSRGFIVDADIYRDKVAGILDRISGVHCFVGIGEAGVCPYDFTTLITEGSADEPDLNVEEGDIATLIYTSGTTGKPKGVPLSHRAWLHSAGVWATELGVHPYTRWLLIMPMHTSGGTGLSLTSAMRGCSLVVSTPDPPKVLDLITREKITFSQFSPTLLANIIRHPNAKQCDFSHIESWFTSAAPISAELLAEGAGYFGKKFTQLYGTTETALLGTVLRPEEVDLDGPNRGRLTSIGKACWGFEAKVVDDDGREIAPGETGELAIKGPAVADGYWNRPDDNARAFVNRNGHRYYRTGDRVRVDSLGNLVFAGRLDRQVKRRGYRIELGEIEAALSGHPAILEVGVVATEKPDGGIVITAFVGTGPSGSLSLLEVKAHCAAALPPYMVPDRVLFVEAVPRGTRGKMDYSALEKLAGE